MDLNFFLPTISEATARTCALVCLTSSYPEAIATRAIDVMATRHQADQDLSVVLSLMVSVLLGKVTAAKLEVAETRQDVLLGAVCTAMHRISSPGRPDPPLHMEYIENRLTEIEVLLLFKVQQIHAFVDHSSVVISVHFRASLRVATLFSEV